MITGHPKYSMKALSLYCFVCFTVIFPEIIFCQLEYVSPGFVFALIKDLAEFKLTLDLLDYCSPSLLPSENGAQSGGRGIKICMKNKF